MTDPQIKPQLSLANAHAVVTGAQQGIGLAIAVALAQAGAHFVANYLDEDAAASDIAPIVQFLASAGAAHVTGQTWHVNGGQYLA